MRGESAGGAQGCWVSGRSDRARAGDDAAFRSLDAAYVFGECAGRVPEGHKDVGYLEEVIEQEQVTTLHFVPSMLRTFLENARGECRSVKRIFSSGEELDRRSAEVYRKRFPAAGLYNLYGPTEA